MLKKMHEMSNDFFGFVALRILLAVISIVILFGGGYIVYERYRLMPSVPQESKGIPVESKGASTSPALDTSNWKTYRNERYGFEVKYPDQQLKEVPQITDNDPNWNSRRVGAFFDRTSIGHDFYRGVFVNIDRIAWAVFRQTPFISLEDYLDYAQKLSNLDVSYKEQLHFEKISISGQEGARESAAGMAATGLPSREARYIFFHNGLVYQIYNGGIDKNLYEEMMNSFRFIN